MNIDEMTILKNVTAKLDNGNYALVTFLYHSEKGNRSKSEYHYVGQILSKADFDKQIADLEADPTADWKFPALENWKVTYLNKNSDGAKWLKMRAKKAVDWAAAWKILNGYKPSKDTYVKTAAYDLTGYKTADKVIDLVEDGSAIADLASGTIFVKSLMPKSKKTAKTENTAIAA